jgi:hypothetical protein
MNQSFINITSASKNLGVFEIVMHNVFQNSFYFENILK